jgi:hypothetical protein
MVTVSGGAIASPPNHRIRDALQIPIDLDARRRNADTCGFNTEIIDVSDTACTMDDQIGID